MVPVAEAAAAFVARLASVGVFVSRPELLTDGLAEFLAAERQAVREACVVQAEGECTEMLRLGRGPEAHALHDLAGRLRALPLE